MLNGAEIMSRYSGESESRLRQAFRDATGPANNTPPHALNGKPPKLVMSPSSEFNRGNAKKGELGAEIAAILEGGVTRVVPPIPVSSDVAAAEALHTPLFDSGFGLVRFINQSNNRSIASSISKSVDPSTNP